MATEEPAAGAAGPARLVIADDHELARAGLRSMLAGERGLEIIGEATTGREALSLCRRLQPDLVLMDVRMPEMDGLEATRTIKEEQPLVGVLVVTTYEDPDYLLGALKAGAAGYVLKDAPKRQLINAVRRVLYGESPLNQELAARLIQRLAGEAAQSAQKPPSLTREKRAGATPPLQKLTPRELEVLALLTQGKTNPQVAETLVISRAPAKVHVERIIRKLGASDRTQAVVRAIELGLLEPETER
jgi:DNA-binding NarL/FixJ family response regulator